ncbi:hypothetical protein ASPCADRAFT_41691, partial [Aspergillus carbonarius ITEM 5010]
SQARQYDSRIKIQRPAIDPTLAPIIDSFMLPEALALDLLRGTLSGVDDLDFVYNATTIHKSAPHLQHTEHSIQGPDGNRVILTVFARKEPTRAALPAVYHIHGGRMIAGNRFTGLPELLDLLTDIESVVVSVEYRLVPETRAPGIAEDCCTGLVGMADHAVQLGIDPARIVVWGMSGGATLAAATCLMARDRNSPKIRTMGQMLVSPMLDDRCNSVSDQQFEYGSPWCGVSNPMAWDHVLGEDRGTNKVGPYQSPSRADDLSILPAIYIGAAECEVFRDQAVNNAREIWRCGSTCELHIWPGAFDLFDGRDNPSVPLIHAAVGAKRDWLRRTMRSME